LNQLIDRITNISAIKVFKNKLSVIKEKTIAVYNHELFWIAIAAMLLRFILSPYFAAISDPYVWARSLIIFNNGYDPYVLHLSVYPPFVVLFYSPLYRILGSLGVVTSYFKFILEFGGAIATPLFLVFWKLPLIFFDLLTGFLIYSFSKELVNNPKIPKIAFIVWIFNPLNLVVTYLHGAWDIAVGFFILLGIFLIYMKSYFTGGISFGIGTLAKLAPIYLFVPFSLIILLQGSKRPILYQIKKKALNFFSYSMGFFLPFLLLAPLVISYFNLTPLLPFSSSESFIANDLNQWFFATHPLGYQLINSNLEIIQNLPIVNFAISVIIVFLLYKNTKFLKIDAEKILLLCVLFGGLSFIFYPSIIQPQYLLWYFPVLVLLLVIRKEFRLPSLTLSVAGITYYFATAGPVTPLQPLMSYSGFLTFGQFVTYLNWYYSLPNIITGLSFQKDLLFLSGLLGFLSLLGIIYHGVKTIWKNQKS
jgi:hypothetical protein